MLLQPWPEEKSLRFTLDEAPFLEAQRIYFGRPAELHIPTTFPDEDDYGLLPSLKQDT